MKRLIGPIVVLFVLLAALYLVYAFLPVRPIFTLPAPAASATAAGGVAMSVQHEYADTDAYHVDAQYPQFAGLSAINTQIKSAVDDAVGQFETYPANPPDSAVQQNTFTGTFDKVYVGADYVSLELEFYQYTGGAHGITGLQTLTFDRATGQELTLEQALALTGLTLAQAAAQADTHFKQSLGSAYFPDGAKPTPDNYGVFVVSADAVTFLFGDYQVAPYAAGVQEMSFPRVQ